jgi:plasmid stability protein
MYFRALCGKRSVVIRGRFLLVIASKAISGGYVATLLIRDVDAVLHMRLKASAAEHRRSLEEEVRELLRTAVARQEAPARENLVALARRLFGPEHGKDLDIPPRGTASESVPPDFSETDDNPSGRP